MTKFLAEKENRKIKFNLTIFNKTLFILIIIIGVYYVAGANDLTVKGFKQQELKMKLKEVISANAGMEQEAMSLKSQKNLNVRVGTLGMVAVGDVQYVSESSSFVAKK